jgi:hypothetical protein
MADPLKLVKKGKAVASFTILQDTHHLPFSNLH